MATNWTTARGATHNSTTIAGVVKFGDDVKLPVVSSPSADGTKVITTPHPSVNVSIVLRDYAAVQSLLAAGQANFVGKYYNDSGQAQKRTYKNVSWHTQSRTEVMEPGSSGVTPAWQLDGVCSPTSDALSTLIVDASDA